MHLYLCYFDNSFFFKRLSIPGSLDQYEYTTLLALWKKGINFCLIGFRWEIIASNFSFCGCAA